MPDFNHETRLGRLSGRIICGVDEVGRGPLAGPVIAAAAILPLDMPAEICKQIRDSKKMSAKNREELFEPLTTLCHYAIAEANVAEIDTLNILWASMLAMQRAVAALKVPDIACVLVDGNRVPELDFTAEAIIRGDDISYSIAAASIIAKVHRDQLMSKLAEEFPHYGWERNAGYGTAAHLRALTEHGTTIWHRTSFAPVRAATPPRSK